MNTMNTMNTVKQIQEMNIDQEEINLDIPNIMRNDNQNNDNEINKTISSEVITIEKTNEMDSGEINTQKDNKKKSFEEEEEEEELTKQTEDIIDDETLFTTIKQKYYISLNKLQYAPYKQLLSQYFLPSTDQHLPSIEETLSLSKQTPQTIDPLLLNLLGIYYQYIVIDRMKMIQYFQWSIDYHHNQDAMFYLGCYYQYQEEYDSMLYYYQLAIETSQDADAMFNLGVYYDQIKRQDELLIYYYQLAINTSQHIDAMCNLAMYYASIQQYSLMKQFYLQAIALNDPESMYQLGYYYQTIEINHEYMLQYYQQAANQYHHTQAWYQLALYYTSQHNDDAMIHAYQQAIEQGQHHASMYNLGLYYMSIELIPLMLYYFQLSIDKYQDCDAMFYVGCYYQSIHSYEQMITYYETAINIGKHTDAMNNLASYYQMIGSQELMIKYYQLAIDHGHVIAMMNLGLFYRLQGKESEMIRCYHLAIQQHYHLLACQRLSEYYDQQHQYVLMKQMCWLQCLLLFAEKKNNQPEKDGGEDKEEDNDGDQNWPYKPDEEVNIFQWKELIPGISTSSSSERNKIRIHEEYYEDMIDYYDHVMILFQCSEINLSPNNINININININDNNNQSHNHKKQIVSLFDNFIVDDQLTNISKEQSNNIYIISQPLQPSQPSELTQQQPTQFILNSPSVIQISKSFYDYILQNIQTKLSSSSKLSLQTFLWICYAQCYYSLEQEEQMYNYLSHAIALNPSEALEYLTSISWLTKLQFYFFLLSLQETHSSVTSSVSITILPCIVQHILRLETQEDSIQYYLQAKESGRLLISQFTQEIDIKSELEEECPICFGQRSKVSLVRLNPCNHLICIDCYFQSNKKCYYRCSLT